METNRQRVVLITGASSGIGEACAHHLHRKGHKVYGTSRRAPWPSDAPMERTDQPATFQLIPMDVTSDESVKQGVQWILEHEGHLDVVVNNAGYGIAGAVESAIWRTKAQMETNFFGVVRLCPRSASNYATARWRVCGQYQLDRRSDRNTISRTIQCKQICCRRADRIATCRSKAVRYPGCTYRAGRLSHGVYGQSAEDTFGGAWDGLCDEVCEGSGSYGDR